MAYRRRGRFFGRRTRRLRPVRYRLRFKRRGYGRRYRRRGISSTRSRIVRISAQLPIPLTYSVTAGGATSYYPAPLAFAPTQLPGFADYASTYSEFRLLKASCKVHLALPDDTATGANLSNNPYTYIRVASRPFIESRSTLGTSGGSNPRALSEIITNSRYTMQDLRQSRWQKQYYPSDIKNKVEFKFYPYTLQWCGRPVGATSNATDPGTQANYMTFLKYQSARQWMPMSFIDNQGTGAAEDDVGFLGPYFVRLLSTEGDSQAMQPFNPVVTLTVYCQFRGQK